MPLAWPAEMPTTGNTARLRRLRRRRGAADVAAVVVELEVGLGAQRDEEVEREVAVRRLREGEDRVPVVQLALQRYDVAREIVRHEVVARRPLRRPLRGDVEAH